MTPLPRHPQLLDLIADRLLPVTDPVGSHQAQQLEAESLARRPTATVLT